MAENLDPRNVNGRLYDQIADLLDALERAGEDLPIRERIAAMVAIGRIQTIFSNLRKASTNDGQAGSAVRRYASAFTPHAARGGKSGAGAAVADADFDDDSETDGVA